MMRFLSTLCVSLFLMSTATAHPGHGDPTASEIQHYLTTRQHIVPALLPGASVLAAGIIAIGMSRRRNLKKSPQ